MSFQSDEGFGSEASLFWSSWADFAVVLQIFLKKASIPVAGALKLGVGFLIFWSLVLKPKPELFLRCGVFSVAALSWREKNLGIFYWLGLVSLLASSFSFRAAGCVLFSFSYCSFGQALANRQCPSWGQASS